jgi:hypothetical protein
MENQDQNQKLDNILKKYIQQTHDACKMVGVDYNSAAGRAMILSISKAVLQAVEEGCMEEEGGSHDVSRCYMAISDALRI